MTPNGNHLIGYDYLGGRKLPDLGKGNDKTAMHPKKMLGRQFFFHLTDSQQCNDVLRFGHHFDVVAEAFDIEDLIQQYFFVLTLAFDIEKSRSLRLLSVDGYWRVLLFQLKNFPRCSTNRLRGGTTTHELSF